MKCGNTECDGYDEDSLYNCDASDFFPETQSCCDFQPLIAEKADGSKVPCSDRVMPNWIVAAQEPHPVGIEFIAYYGNGSKEKRVTCLNGIDLAISLWLPLPELPEA